MGTNKDIITTYLQSYPKKWFRIKEIASGTNLHKSVVSCTINAMRKQRIVKYEFVEGFNTRVIHDMKCMIPTQFNVYHLNN